MKFLIALSLFTTVALAADTGKPAPNFTLPGAHAKSVELSKLKGKIVVLEWLNHGCPFVRKHYESGNMQALQKKYTDKGVVWLSIISSAPGKQGHVDAGQAKAEMTAHKSAATDVLMDSEGAVGKLYDAKTTPHMYVIDRQGLLAYQGAIDDKPSTDMEDVKGAKNYVAEALDAVLAGKKVARAMTQSYGCSVKY